MAEGDRGTGWNSGVVEGWLCYLLSEAAVPLWEEGIAQLKGFLGRYHTIPWQCPFPLSLPTSHALPHEDSTGYSCVLAVAPHSSSSLHKDEPPNSFLPLWHPPLPAFPVAPLLPDRKKGLVGTGEPQAIKKRSGPKSLQIIKIICNSIHNCFS